MRTIADLCLLVAPVVVDACERLGRRDLATTITRWTCTTIGTLRIVEHITSTTTEPEVRALCWALAVELGDDPTHFIFEHLATDTTTPIDLRTLVPFLHSAMGEALTLNAADRIAAVWRKVAPLVEGLGPEPQQ